MSLVNTTFLTIDNRKLVVPNNMIWQSVITNYTDFVYMRLATHLSIWSCDPGYEQVTIGKLTGA